MSEGTPGSFWKEVFDDFEEASALAFGYDERDVQTDSGWQITFPEDMDEGLLLSSWALLQSRYSGERFITIGIQPKNESAVRPLRIAVDEELSSTAYVASVEQQLDDQLNRHPIDPSELRNILELPSGQALFCSTLAHKPNKSVQLTGSGAFSEAVLYRVSRHIERLLDHLSRRDDSPIEFFSHLSESELRQVVQDWILCQF